jgi:type II secretory pathway pseudopilin PulG
MTFAAARQALHAMEARMRHGSARGFTYLGVLLALALVGIGLLAVSEVWVTSAHRQRRAQLDWIGRQFEQAIGSYYESSPGGTRSYPKALQQLLLDPRYPTARRHLRQIYPDPFNGVAHWSLLRLPDGGIRAVCAEAPAIAGWPSERLAFGYTPGVAVDPVNRREARTALAHGCPRRQAAER